MTVVDHKDFVNKIQDQTYENENKINQATVDDLKNEIDRLSEEVSNLKLINSEHKKLNAKLQKEMKDKEETTLMKYHTP